MAFWSKAAHGHWELRRDGVTVAEVHRQGERWRWVLTPNGLATDDSLTSSANTLNDAMLAVGRARRRDTIRSA